jgi:sarcosine oxidase, subunit gamma
MAELRRSNPTIAECPAVRLLQPASRHVLRGGTEVMSVAGSALGLEMPEALCRATVSADRAALKLGPDECLLLGPEPAAQETTSLLEQALGDLPHALVDVSHRQIALEVRGRHAAFLLNAGCPLDLHTSAFPIGMCTRTVFAKAEIVLWRTGEEMFQIEVWRSFAAYVSRFLAESEREVGAS